MSNIEYVDAEYESIRTIMKGRGRNGGQLPGKVIRYIPESRADRILALDARVEVLKKIAPYVGAAMGLLIGLML